MGDHRRARSAGEGRQCSRLDSAATIPRHFFRIMLPVIIQEKKLRIPKRFITRFGDKVSDVATLYVPNGSAWNVKLERVDKEIYFKDGWHEFVQHHGINEFYFLVFRYKGKSSFEVVIFDLSTTEICYDQEPTHGKQCPLHHEEELEEEEEEEEDGDDDDDDSIEILGSLSAPCSIPNSLEKNDEDDDCSIEILGSSTPCLFSTSFNNKKRTIGENCNPATKKNLSATTWGQNSALLKKKGFEHEYLTRTKRSITDHLNESNQGNVKNELGPDQIKKKKPKSEPDDDDEQPTKNGKENIFFDTKTLPRGGPMKKAVVTQKREDAIRAASMYKPENLSFMSILRSFNLAYSGFVNVPAEFSRKCPMQFPEFIKLRHPSNGREWCVRCIQYDYKGWKISKGWPLFVLENDLKEGDACVFELIQGGAEGVLKVTIFRANEDSGS